MVPRLIRRGQMVDRLFESVFNTNQSESVYISQIYLRQMVLLGSDQGWTVMDSDGQ
jgi:hypothetical protein